jgi:luciferase family oxidoreductase group 1
VLHALYPDRIDLGIGRGLGGSPLDREGVGSVALQRVRQGAHPQDDIAEQLVELLSFLNKDFPPQHPFSRILVTPDMPGAPEVWLLGSTGWSADAAAQLGLPFAAAHFLNPNATRECIQHYHEAFRPSPSLSQPHAMVAVAAVCAGSEAEAERLYSSQRLLRLLSEQPAPDPNEAGPVPPPDEAMARLKKLPPSRFPDRSEWPRAILGAPEQVHRQLTSMAAALELDELMLITVVHDHSARLRSYELLAEAFGLEGRKP